MLWISSSELSEKEITASFSLFIYAILEKASFDSSTTPKRYSIGYYYYFSFLFIELLISSVSWRKNCCI